MLISRMPRFARGFSLIELAIGLVIVATLLSALLVPLATQMDQRRTAETQRALEAARDALVGFAIANGRLPCPAVDATSGAETFATGGSATNGNCATTTGFLPAVALGLDGVNGSGLLLDAFGGPVRYAVAMPSGLAGIPDNAFTRTDGMKTSATMRAITSSSSLLSICSEASTSTTSCSAGATLANGNVIAVIYSLGKNGTDTVRTLATDEAENMPEAGDRVFVNRVRNDQTGYDDMLVWISPATLISRMTAGGTLP
jgi:prepilin-type N-terminal cleavage/methylation domain-containing protein